VKKTSKKTATKKPVKTADKKTTTAKKSAATAAKKKATVKKATKTTTAKKTTKVAPKKKAPEKAQKDLKYECTVCGFRVIVDEFCGCVEEHILLCCNKPMKKTRTRRAA
jgi:DNA-directed RNA polymerase subunit RPC12/RpoP